MMTNQRQKLTTFLRAPFVYKNWIYFYLSRFFKKNGILRLRKGYVFKIRPQQNDRSTITDQFVFKTYLRGKSFELYPRDVVVDIGANVGAFTIYAAKECCEGKIVAVEPIAENFEVLCENIQLNNLRNVTVKQAALDSTSGTRKFFVNKSTTSSFFWGTPNGTSRSVLTVTLRQLLDEAGIEKVDFLKMDCEGAEFDILMNLDEEMLSKIKRVALEFHDLSREKSGKELKPYLEKKGFTVELTGNPECGYLFGKRKQTALA